MKRLYRKETVQVKPERGTVPTRILFSKKLPLDHMTYWEKKHVYREGGIRSRVNKRITRGTAAEKNEKTRKSPR